MHHGKHVSLWVDDLAVMQRLCPTLSMQHDAQQLEGVWIRRWIPPFVPVSDDDVVIEAFGCELPDEVLARMANRERAPAWINLEYLSAEDWVEGCHRLPSPHSRLPLKRHFFFPGFTAETGGLLREPGLLSRRDAFRATREARSTLLSRLSGGDLPSDVLSISLFAYDQPGLGALLRCWSGAERSVALLVPEGRVVPDIARYFGRVGLHPGEHLKEGSLSVHVLPFTDQDAYDRLLWACDLNFVRGEDSFVRAQWAAAPFVWHIYPQQEDIHLVKLDAFLERFLAGAPPALAVPVTAFWRAWNGIGDPVASWPAFCDALPEFTRHCQRWCDELAQQHDLVTALLEFSETGV
jgi:uncharacterized repeat protein (TIGR03837 family)